MTTAGLWSHPTVHASLGSSLHVRCRLRSWQGAHHRPRVRCHTQPDPYEVLGCPRSASRAAIRAAYLERMKLLHPDMNLDEDTTVQAVAINAAYLTLTEGFSGSGDDDEDDLPDAFDFPEAEPTEVFVNPFACSINPLDWREVQALVDGAEDPETALQRAGLYFNGGAVAYLTPAQKAVLLAELENMEVTLGYDMAAYYVTDCLLRARFTNNRMEVARRF